MFSYIYIYKKKTSFLKKIKIVLEWLRPPSPLKIQIYHTELIFCIEMQENNQLITINIYLRAFYLYAIEATRKHQLSHLLNEPFFIYLVVVIVIICISWRKSKLIKISSFLLPYFEITLTFFFSTLSMVFISKHSIDLIMNWEGFLLFQGKKNSVEDDNIWQLEWFFPFHESKSFSWPVYIFYVI